jgi:bifunctional UDP-N-acetylglucosamine pyrophosphorylase / glucosamine-1-phosphate N-acetyltransferase
MGGVTDRSVVILAAGEGKRMRSRRPKTLHVLCGRPLIGYALRTARLLADRIVVVVGPDAEGIRTAVGVGVEFAEQTERLGTGHALLQARSACTGGTVVVMPGDMPLLSPATLEGLIEHHTATAAAVTVLTATVDRPQGYGRVLRHHGRVQGIIEDRDATDDQKRIAEINTSVYCFDSRRLWPALERVEAHNEQGEYYLTDVIGILARTGARVEAIMVDDPAEALGVNDRKQLAAVAAIQRQRTLDRLMLEGVTIVDPATAYVDDTVRIGPDTILGPNVSLQGTTVVGAECVIDMGCRLAGSRLADGVTLLPYCVLTEAVVEEKATLGPFCYLRPQSQVGPGARIGNFVELKKARIGRGSKVPHLAYVGDAIVGDAANIGAGAIMVNYDGVHKHQTTIGDGAFVGSNVNLIAPVTIGAGAYVAAGSTITKDVPPDALAVERGQQAVKEGWAARRRQNRPRSSTAPAPRQGP